jgi:hypothetical protein
VIFSSVYLLVRSLLGCLMVIVRAENLVHIVRPGDTR